MLQNIDEAKETEEEGYMGTQYDSSEDMAVDMLKKGIKEATSLKLKGYYQILDPGMNEWQDDYQYMGIIADGSSVGEVGEHMFVYPYSPGSFTFVSISDADLDTMVKPSMNEGKEKEEEALNEMLSTSHQQLIQNIVDNWSDGGIDAEPAMTRIDKILQGNLEDEEDNIEAFGGINEKTDPYDQFIKKTKTGKELQPFHPKMKYGFEGYKGKENIKAKDMSSQKLTGAGYYRMSDDEFKKYQDLGLDGGSARVPFKLEGLNEALEPHVYERMYNLSNIKAQQAMIRAAEILMRDLTAEGFEVPEIREFFTQLIANDI
jgi:hypothetical protein